MAYPTPKDKRQRLIRELEAAVDRYIANEKYYERGLEELELTPRIRRKLEAAGMSTIGSLTSAEAADIRRISGLGSKGLYDIEQALAEYGLALYASHDRRVR